MEVILYQLLDYLVAVVLTTIFQTFILVGPVLILVFLANFLAQFIQEQSYNFLGRTLFLVILAWFGTAVHETGHLIFSFLFGHQIKEVKLFDPKPKNGVLGYVRFAFNPRNAFQAIGLLFSSIGPIILGTLVVWLASYILLGPGVFSVLKLEFVEDGVLSVLELLVGLVTSIAQGTGGILSAILTNESLLTWKGFLFLYITLSVGCAMTLSPPDIQNAAVGFFVLVRVLFLFNLATFWIGPFVLPLMLELSRVYSGFYAVMVFVLILNGLLSLALLPYSALQWRK